jgi:hypothetical protein
MKAETMTDEDVEKALSDLYCGRDPSGAREKVRAHIAALAAERDEAVRQREATEQAYRGGLQERDTLRERAEVLERANEVGSAASLRWGEEHARAERAEERVRTLEAENAEERLKRGLAEQAVTRSLQTAKTAESRLSDILQRQLAGEDAMVERARTRFRQARNEGLGLDAALMATTIDTARYVVGEDGAGAKQDEEPSPAQQDWDGQHPHDAPEDAAPTTPEAFAMLQRLANEHIDDEARCLFRGNRSLLERRMGAMDGAARRVVEVFDAAEHSGLGAAESNALDALETALTDAPPVFTLEEVEKAFREWKANPTVSFSQALAALRR